MKNNKFTYTLSADGLMLTIYGIRKTRPFIFKIPDKSSKSKMLKLIFWYYTESDSFKSLGYSSLENKCSSLEPFFDFLNASDVNGKNYIDTVINHKGELSDGFLTVYDSFLIHLGQTSSNRNRFQQNIKIMVNAYATHNPDYRSLSLYTTLIDSILNKKITSYTTIPKQSAGSIINMIATHDQQKSFESDWFMSFSLHFPLMLNKIREEVKKVKHVRNLLKELEQSESIKEEGYQNFVSGTGILNQSNVYVQKTFEFYEALLKDGSEFLVDCVYHSLNPKLFDDHVEWQNISTEAPLKRFKEEGMSCSEWLEYKRNSLDFFKRKGKSKYEGLYTPYSSSGGRNAKQVQFTISFFFTLKHLIKPSKTEYMVLRFLLGWHQFTEIEPQNKLTLDDITPFNDGTIKILKAYKKRTGDIDGIRDIPIQEFPKNSKEYKVFKIYREMLSESYKKYSSVFTFESADEKLLFSDNDISKGACYYTSESFSNLFSFVVKFASGENGQKSKLFYDLFGKWMEISQSKKGFSGKSEDAKEKFLKKIKSYLNDDWKKLTVEQFTKLTISYLNANSFRLAAQGYVQAYAVYAGRVAVNQHLKNNSADEVIGSFHAHSSDMDHQYMIKSRNPHLAESENVFGQQVASEMIEQAKIAWSNVLAPLEVELQNQLNQTDVWSLEELRDYLGISSLEEMHNYRNESEQARNYLLELLEKDNIKTLEGYGHHVIGAINQLNYRQIVLDTPLTCFLMMHQINYLDEQIESFLNKKVTPNKEKLDSITVKALVTRAFFSEMVETRFSETTRKGAKELLKNYSDFPPISL